MATSSCLIESPALFEMLRISASARALNENDYNLTTPTGYSSYEIVRRHSMFSAFPMGPAASERGLCDIDKVLLRVTTYIMCHHDTVMCHMWYIMRQKIGKFL